MKLTPNRVTPAPCDDIDMLVPFGCGTEDNLLTRCRKNIIPENNEDKTMPDDIWITIFKYFRKDPALFNFYNVTSQFERVLDNYFKQPITIDFEKYILSNKASNIAQQVDYIMHYCNRNINGIIISGNVGEIDDKPGPAIRHNNPLGLKIYDRPGQAVQAIRHNNPLGLKLFHYDVSYRMSVVPQFVIDVVHDALNLVNLHVNLRNDRSHQPFDFSGLLQLKVLEVSHVHIGVINCQSPNITRLVLKTIFNADPAQLLQTLNTAAQHIEHFELDRVHKNQCNHTDVDLNVLPMPKLVRLELCGVRMSDLIINLAASTNLCHINVSLSDCRITNFDLSNHCIEYCTIQDDRMLQLFIDSVLINLDHLCLLKYLHIVGITLSQLSGMLRYVSHYDKYALQTFCVGGVVRNATILDMNDLVKLIKRSPLLEQLIFTYYINKQTLINFIMDIVHVVRTDLTLNVQCRSVFDATAYEFMSDLYNALTDDVIEGRLCKVNIEFTYYNDKDWSSSENIKLRNKLTNDFGVCVSSCE